MTQRRAQIDPEATGAAFGDILDRMPGRAPQAAPPVSQPRQRPRPQQESKPIKVSLYLSPEDINALDAIIMQRRLEEGVSPRRTHLIREAIHQWLEERRA